MKILIAYTLAGAGHFKAAEAIYNYFRKKNPHLELKLIDALAGASFLFRKSYLYGYSFCINYAPWLWSFAFRISSAKCLKPITSLVRFFINRINTQGFARTLIQEAPDVIISTHFLPSEISAYLKNTKKISSQIFTVITDFGVHPFWVSEGTDAYIVASDFTKNALIKEGVAESRIQTLGIPVGQKFLADLDRIALCKKFNIHPDKFTLLIVTGSFGIGPIEKIVDLLYKEAQLLVVCARNRRLFAKLTRKNYPGVKVFGFVNNLAELMAVSDIIVTKPGGLTISEAFVLKIVPVFISAIPGQETENLRVLAKLGATSIAKNIKEIKDTVLNYKTGSDELSRIKENISKLRKPSAVEDLYHVICPSSPEYTG
jgi:processive 1,2-diacylglycerol beta-glucosyltransferase